MLVTLNERTSFNNLLSENNMMSNYFYKLKAHFF